jgi:uncharacterized protein (UPF0548 family)
MPRVHESVFRVREPSQTAVDKFLTHAKDQAFSYPEIGSTRRQAPAGYTVDHNRITLGSGSETFQRAAAAIRAWKMFDMGWARLHPPNAPIETGTTVAVVFHHFGFWSMNGCRVVYLIEEERRYGFAYGTIAQHAERGEERFSVEWNANNDSVVYDIYAFSRPAQWQTRIANPLARMLQKRFVRDSKAAMQRAVGGESNP